MLYNTNIEQMKGSASVELMQKAEEMKRQGKKVISLAGGEPDFDTPIQIRRVACKAIQDGYTHYAVGKGLLPLREKIAEKCNRENGIAGTADNVIVTPGGKYGIYIAVRSVVNDGDEVLVLNPAWVSYGPIITASGGVPVNVKLEFSDNYRITEEILEKNITDKTKAIIINYPNNPTGRLLHMDEALLLKKMVEKYHIFIISDEVYEKIVFDGKEHISMGAFETIKEYVITVNGFSKSVAMTGWRLGYTMASDETTERMYRLFLHTITGVSTFIQKAAIEAFSCDDEIEKMRKSYEQRRNYFVDALNQIPGVQCRTPEGAFYAWVRFASEKTSAQLCQMLLDKYGIIGVPGSGYGENDDCCVRFSFANELSDLKDVIKKIAMESEW